jgi:hypothetical protein
MVKMGTVWDRTAEFLTDNLSALLPLALLAFFVPYSISGSFQQAGEAATFSLALVLQLVSLAFAVLGVWGSLAIIAMVLDTDPKAAGAVASRRLIAALVVALVLLVAFAVLLAPVWAMLAASGYTLAALQAGTPPDLSAGTRGAMILYVVVALGVALWISARLILINPVIVAEKQMLGAVARSWRLTRRYALSIVGVILLYLLVSVVAVLATQTVFGSVFRLIAGAPTSGLSLSLVLTSVMVAAVQTGFTVLVPVFTTKFYLALVAEHGQAPAS